MHTKLGIWLAHNDSVYLCQIFWSTQILLVKLSILCLYLRIFPSRSFRLTVYITIGILVGTFFPLVFMAAFQCLPIEAIWNIDIKHAKCLNLENIALASGAINMLTELIILILPMPVVRSLHLSTKRRIRLYVLFGAGVVYVLPFSSQNLDS